MEDMPPVANEDIPEEAIREYQECLARFDLCDCEECPECIIAETRLDILERQYPGIKNIPL